MIVFITFCLLVGFLLYEITKRPPGFPPGPLNLPIVGYLPIYKAEPYKKLMALRKRYGDVISVNWGPFYRFVILNSYSAMKDAYKEDVFSGRPDTYLFHLRGEGKHGVTFNHGADWQELRRASLRVLRDFGFGSSSLETAISSEVSELISSLRKEVGHPVTLSGRFNLSVINALWAITTGERIPLDDPEMKPIITNMSKSIADIDISGLPIILPFSPYIPPKAIGAQNFVEQASFLTDLFKKEIMKQKEKLTKEGQADNYIKSFLEKMEQTTDPTSALYGDKGLKNLVFMIFDLFVAGAETVSSTLTWLILMMARNPRIQEQVHEELDRAIGKNRLPCLDDKAQLPFTEAVILETQRVGSQLPFAMHRVTSDTEFRGFKIPKGTFVGANLYGALHDPELWEKPNEFYPQHFLDDKGNVKQIEHFVPFSIGKRVCLGESLAKMELFLFASQLMHSFKFAFPQDEPPPTLEVTRSIVRVPLPFKVVISSR